MKKTRFASLECHLKESQASIRISCRRSITSPPFCSYGVTKSETCCKELSQSIVDYGFRRLTVFESIGHKDVEEANHHWPCQRSEAFGNFMFVIRCMQDPLYPWFRNAKE